MGVCKPPVAAGGGAGDRLYSIVPGKPAESILVYRMQSAKPDEMMPELEELLCMSRGRTDQPVDSLPVRWLQLAGMQMEQRPARILVISVLLLCALLLQTCSDNSHHRSSYVLATGTTGGTFYPVGVALSTWPRRKQRQFSLTAISSAGSMENIKLLRDNQCPICSCPRHFRGLGI